LFFKNISHAVWAKNQKKVPMFIALFFSIFSLFYCALANQTKKNKVYFRESRFHEKKLIWQLSFLKKREQN